jgi:hypothetical protein
MEQMTAVELIEEKVKFEIDIVKMDYNNGVQISMSVFSGMLKKILIQVEQAKKMEKQQIINAWEDVGADGITTAEQYYKETFKSEE